MLPCRLIDVKRRPPSTPLDTRTLKDPFQNPRATNGIGEYTTSKSQPSIVVKSFSQIRIHAIVVALK